MTRCTSVPRVKKFLIFKIRCLSISEKILQKHRLINRKIIFIVPPCTPGSQKLGGQCPPHTPRLRRPWVSVCPAGLLQHGRAQTISIDSSRPSPDARPASTMRPEVRSSTRTCLIRTRQHNKTVQYDIKTPANTKNIKMHDILCRYVIDFSSTHSATFITRSHSPCDTRPSRHCSQD